MTSPGPRFFMQSTRERKEFQRSRKQSAVMTIEAVAVLQLCLEKVRHTYDRIAVFGPVHQNVALGLGRNLLSMNVTTCLNCVCCCRKCMNVLSLG